MLCVDTNFINWLRLPGISGYNLCRKCVYVPNYADIGTTRDSGLELPETRCESSVPGNLKKKRGLLLLLAALSELQARGIAFEATICAVGGHEPLDR